MEKYSRNIRFRKHNCTWTCTSLCPKRIDGHIRLSLGLQTGMQWTIDGGGYSVYLLDFLRSTVYPLFRKRQGYSGMGELHVGIRRIFWIFLKHRMPFALKKTNLLAVRSVLSVYRLLFIRLHHWTEIYSIYSIVQTMCKPWAYNLILEHIHSFFTTLLLAPKIRIIAGERSELYGKCLITSQRNFWPIAVF